MNRNLACVVGVLLGLLACAQAQCVVQFAEQTFPQWECDVCGYLLENYDLPFICAPLNVTVGADAASCTEPEADAVQFDNISPGPINGKYETLTWQTFDVVAQNSSFGLPRQVVPYSKPQYASVASGATGVLSGFDGGIYSTYYGCVNAFTGFAASCQVTIVGECANIGNVTTTLTYEPSSVFGAPMAYAKDVIYKFFASNGDYTGDVCNRFTFSAVGVVEAIDLLNDPLDVLSDPVVLLLDDIHIAIIEDNPING